MVSTPISPVCANAKMDLHLLKKLLAYRMALLRDTQLPLSSTTTESPSLHVPSLINRASPLDASLEAPMNVTSLAGEFHAYLGTNSSLDAKVRSVFLRAVPLLQSTIDGQDFGGDSEMASRRQALLALAAEMHPLIAPFAEDKPNFTADVRALGETFYNRTSRGP